MLKVEKDEKSYALDQLREYLIFNNIIVENKWELRRVYSKMYNEEYFFKEKGNDFIKKVKNCLEEFADAFEQNHDILERDLIFYGPRRVIDKMDKLKYSNSQIKR